MKDEMVVQELLKNYDIDSVHSSHLKDHYECCIKSGHVECLGNGPDLESAFYDAYRQVMKLQGRPQYTLKPAPLPPSTTLDDAANPSRWSRFKRWCRSEYEWFKSVCEFWFCDFY